MAQTYTSANTSINKTKVPAIFKKVHWHRYQINLDLGGGKFDTATDYLRETYGAYNVVIDPYNRSEEHNNEALHFLRDRGADTCTISNVLNVVDSAEARHEILALARDLTRSLGAVYITVYEGDGTGTGRRTGKDQWQNNKRLADYYPEVLRVFPDAYVRNGMIVAIPVK